MAEFRCDRCDKRFGSQESLNQHNQAKHSAHSSNAKKPLLAARQKNKIRNWGLSIFIIIVIVGGLWLIISGAKTLPPTSMDGHIEANPASHILKEPMRIEVQKHMLEHADGTGPPGVIINYNCEDFACEDALIPQLEAFAGRYDFVYVAPFPNMDAKIALTALNRIQTLESFDEQAIENFIMGR